MIGNAGPKRRYAIRLAILMAVYLIVLFAAVTTFRSHSVSGPAAFVLALAPALPVIGVFWAVMRLMVELDDEYLRMLMVRQTLFATGLTLGCATAWGFLEQFELVMHIEAFYWAVLWFFGLGAGTVFNRLTVGTGVCVP